MENNSKGIAVSIIVPVYNVGKYINDCLNSILDQTVQSYEVICVNDGSTDDSWKIIQEFTKKNHHFKLINNLENHGQSFARNCGMRIARGKYIIFLDADDTLAREAVEELYDMAESSQSDLILYDMEYQFESRELEQRFPDIVHMNPLFDGVLMSGTKLYCQFDEKGGPLMTAATIFFKRIFLVNNNIWFNELIIYEDNLFVFQCMTIAKRVRCTANRYYRYLRRANSTTTSKITMKNIISFYYIYDDEVNWMLIHKIPNEYLNAIGEHIAKQYCAAAYLAIKYRDCLSLKLIEKDRKYPAEFKMKFLIFLRQIVGGYVKNLSARDIEIISKYPYVIIYGAGKVARSSIQYLSDCGINKFVIAVTKAHKDSYLMGNKIHSIYSLKFDKGKCVVLLAVARSNQSSIIQNLKRLSYDNIISLT